MKSQEKLLHDTVVGILKDYQLAYPAYRGVSKDIERLSLLAETRGLGLFTLDLPNLEKLLLEGLELGRLVLSGPLSRKVSDRYQVPRLFRGIWLRVFMPNACLREEPDPTAIAFLRQLCCLGKKIEVSCSRQRLKETLDEYERIESRLPEPTLGWYYDELYSASDDQCVHFCDAIDRSRPVRLFALDEHKFEPGDATLLRSLQQVADDLVGSFSPFDPTSYSTRRAQKGRGFSGFRHGPGAVADAKGKRGTIDKFQFPHWPQKLQMSFPQQYCADGHSPFHAATEKRSYHEPPAVLHAVPKTAKGPRLIAAEPIAHQWCQQLTLDYLLGQIKRVIGDGFITLHDQSRSHELVVRGSLDRSLVTVDLSSASDRLSCWVVERAFRTNPYLLSALHSSRTRWLVNRIGEHPSFLKLRKFASQGTAVTFPVQSIIFFLCVLASLPGKNTFAKMIMYEGQVRVFGDDIIMPRTGYASLVRLLDILGLKVNESKSFSNSFFRESCGLDCFKGYDVTPLKPRSISGRTPEGWISLLQLSNNLFTKGYWNAAKVIEMELYATMPRRIRRSMLHVVGHSSGATGLVSFVGGNVSKSAKIRYNNHLHRTEVSSITVRSVMRGSEPSGGSMLLRFFNEGSAPENPRDFRLRTTLRVSNYPGWEPASSFDYIEARAA